MAFPSDVDFDVETDSNLGTQGNNGGGCHIDNLTFNIQDIVITISEITLPKSPILDPYLKAQLRAVAILQGEYSGI